MSWPQWLVVDNELGGAPASWGVDAANAVSGRPTDPGGASGDRRERAAVSADRGAYVRYCTYGAAPRKYRRVVIFREHNERLAVPSATHSSVDIGVPADRVFGASAPLRCR